jgi:hypothetical protein
VAHLKKLRRAEEGANILGVFREMIPDGIDGMVHFLHGINSILY